MRVGKNQFAEYLTESIQGSIGASVGQDLFARALKDGCKNDFKLLSLCLSKLNLEIKANIYSLLSTANFKRPEIDNQMKNLNKLLDQLIIKDECWYENKTIITRAILQLVGTEIFRKRVDNDWWPKILRKNILESDNDVTVVPDCRFPNEITVFEEDIIKNNLKVVTIRVERTINTNKDAASHDSETALDNWKNWDYIVDNNGSLQDLKNAAQTIVKDVFNEDDNEQEDFWTVSKRNAGQSRIS